MEPLQGQPQFIRAVLSVPLSSPWKSRAAVRAGMGPRQNPEHSNCRTADRSIACVHHQLIAHCSSQLGHKQGEK